MKSKTVILIIAAVVIVAGIGFYLARQKQAPLQNETAEKNAASEIFNLSFTNYSGGAVSLSDFKGNPLVINSWAAWCPFCRKELVDFVAAQKEFGDKVIIVAIDRAEARETAKKYTDELGITGDMVFLLDPSDNFYRSIGGFSMPETIFVDSNGAIVFHKRGPMDLNEIRERVGQLLQL